MMQAFDIPPVWALLMAALALTLDRIAPFGEFAGPATDGAGVAFAAGGVALASWAMMRFRRRATPIEPRKRPSALVEDGPYSFNRNPMYTGLTLLVLGLAVWLGSPAALAPAVALPVILTARFIRDEENRLIAEFGEEARAFFNRTRRW